MRYYTQTQAPAGNWTDVLGTNVLVSACSFADYQRRVLGKTARVIERVDTPVRLPCKCPAYPYPHAPGYGRCKEPRS